jgi:hypothetical protein
MDKSFVGGDKKKGNGEKDAEIGHLNTLNFSPEVESAAFVSDWNFRRPTPG